MRSARSIANHLLEADDDLDPKSEVARLTSAPYPGIEVEVEGNHWNVYKQWQGSQHFIGEIYYDDMKDAPPEAIPHWDNTRWMSIAGFRESEFKACKTFDEAVQWIIAVNVAKTTPVREAVDPDDPEANIERFATDVTKPVSIDIHSYLSNRNFRVTLRFDKLAGGTSYDRQGRVLQEKPQPQVEFYDLTYADDPKRPTFKGNGQFVSGYFAATIVERQPGVGLDLYGGEPAWQIDGGTMDEVTRWIRAECEKRGYKLVDDIFGKQYESEEADNPDVYLHPEKYRQQPSDEKIESALRVMLAPYYTRVSVNKRPGLFNTAGSDTRMSKRTSAGPFQNSFVWTIHCNRDTPLPLSIVNRNLPGYDLDWRQEVKHWFEKWASRHNLSLLKFEIYGRLRKDPTFQFETVSFGPLKENEDDLTPERFIQHHIDFADKDQQIVQALWKFHPYGVGYNAMIGPRFALITCQTYFPVEKDNFITRFRDFVVGWLTDNHVMKVDSTKLTAGGGHDKDYPRWSIFLAVNMDWPPDEPAYVPPAVEPGAGAPVEVGQP